MPDDPLEGIDLDKIDLMSEEDLDKTLASLGLGQSDDDDEGTSPTADDAVAGLDGGQEAAPKPAEVTAPKLTGQALLDEFKTNPEAQSLVQAQLDAYLRDASAKADAQKQKEEYDRLIAEGDFEEIGKRYVTAQKDTEVRTAVEQEALTKAYGEVYTKLFNELNAFELGEEDKVKIAPERYATDAEYVLALSNFISEKKSGSSIEALVDQRVEEKLEALRNMKSAQAATATSVSSALPSGTATAGNGGKETSRSLIQDGFHEYLEESADKRVAVT